MYKPYVIKKSDQSGRTYTLGNNGEWYIATNSAMYFNLIADARKYFRASVAQGLSGFWIEDKNGKPYRIR